MSGDIAGVVRIICFPQFVNNKVCFPVGQLLVENFVFVKFALQQSRKRGNAVACSEDVFYFCLKHTEYGSVTLFSCDERRKFQAQ